MPWLLVSTVPRAKELLPALPSACCASSFTQETVAAFWLAIFTPMNTLKMPLLCLCSPAAYLPVPWLERALALGAGSKQGMVGRTSVWRGCGGQLEKEVVSSAAAGLLAVGCRRCGLLPKPG